MAPLWKFLTVGAAFIAPATVMAQGEGEDDPKYRELCDRGLNTKEPSKCWNCWGYLENGDDFDSCAVLISYNDVLSCSDDLDAELTTQNQLLLEMSKVDSDNPFDWTKSKDKWSAGFLVGTTAIPDQPSVFGAWRSAIGEISFQPEYLNELPRRWNMAVRKKGGNVDTIEMGWGCPPP